MTSEEIVQQKPEIAKPRWHGLRKFLMSLGRKLVIDRSSSELLDKLESFERAIRSSPAGVAQDIQYWWEHIIFSLGLGDKDLLPSLLEAVSVEGFKGETRKQVIVSKQYRKLLSLYRQVCRLAFLSHPRKYVRKLDAYRDAYRDLEYLFALNEHLAPLYVQIGRGPNQHPLIRDMMKIVNKVNRTSTERLARDADRQKAKRLMMKQAGTNDRTAAERKRRERARKKELANPPAAFDDFVFLN